MVRSPLLIATPKLAVTQAFRSLPGNRLFRDRSPHAFGESESGVQFGRDDQEFFAAIAAYGIVRSNAFRFAEQGRRSKSQPYGRLFASPHEGQGVPTVWIGIAETGRRNALHELLDGNRRRA